MNNIQIAIDGPSGSGKSTISKQIAKELNIIYLDTGAMYRAITFKALENNIEHHMLNELLYMLKNTKIEFKNNNIYLDNDDISKEIRSIIVTENVSKFAQIKEVRDDLVKRQKNIASNNSIIMDGRDIASRVLPNAKYKFYLTASIEERAKRRYKEFLNSGKDVEYEKIKEDIALRDYNDSNREESPLIKTNDAIEVDTTSMNIKEVISYIINYIKKGEINDL